MADKPTLHLVGIFHTQHTAAYSHCAFTGKALRFSKMLRMYGYRVVEYANAGSESLADEHVPMLTLSEFDEMLGRRDKTAFHGNDATVGAPHHTLFEQRLVPAMQQRVKPKDIICHPFGHAHSRLLQDFPNNVHVETGIGYPTLVDGTIRIFESYAWRHYHAGKDGRQGAHYEYVIPNYFDINDWQPKFSPGSYYAFLGRIDACKGLDTLQEIAKHLPADGPKIVLCGQGDHSRWAHPNIVYKGPLKGTERSEFMRNAICSLMPTNFIEPFGGSGVEGLLCGTPLIATDYGAFTETVQPGFNGFRCKTLLDWLTALQKVTALDRAAIASAARATYSLEACGARYDEAFQQIYQLYDKGWYTLPPDWGQKQRCLSPVCASV
ncbi:MAG: glycosyltransferase [Betaproteobacteria bacterium]|nr:glycosyltransferase [Betaproteobacteria bacterium]